MAELAAHMPFTPAPAGLVQKAPAGRKVAIDYLRTFVIVLVLVHHSLLAYVTFGHFDPVHYTWSTAPIVDSAHWLPFDVIVAVNDIYFMSLMFFVSGVFVWPSLARKGAGRFLRDRFLRLGLPFAVVVTFLIPLAYYPSFLMTGANPGYFAFWRDTILIGPWPAGPPWFVFALLVFDCAAVLIYRAAPRLDQTMRSRAAGIFNRPVIFFLVLVVASAAVYTPMLFGFGFTDWFAFGPLTIQASRALHYFIYFLAGVALGAYGLDRSAFVPGGSLARWWPLWMLAAIVATLGFLRVVIHWPPPIFTYARVFVLACALLSLAWMAIFLRFVKRRHAIVESLNDNSYGIYLIHYLFVIWLQYALLGTSLPAAAKGLIVFAGVLALSWASVAALRRIPAVAKVI